MPPLDLIRDVVLNAILPAAIPAAVLLALVVALGGSKWASVGVALGLATGAAFGLWRRGALTLISPDESAWNRLPLAALAAIAVSLIARLLLGLAPSSSERTRPGRVALIILGWLLRAGAAAAVAWWVIPANKQTEISWLAPALAAVLFAEWLVLEPIASRPPGGTVPLALALCAFVAADVLIHAGTARLMEAAIVLFGALGGIALIAWWRRLDAGVAAPAATVFLCGLLLMGHEETFHDLSWRAFALPALAPLALVVTLPCNRRAVRLQLVRLALLLIPLAIAALEAGPPDFDELEPQNQADEWTCRQVNWR